MWNMARAIANEGLALLIAHYNYTLCLRSCGLSRGVGMATTQRFEAIAGSDILPAPSA